MKICGSERDRNLWPSRYCGESGGWKPASSTTRQALTWNPQGKGRRCQPRSSWRRDTEAVCLLVGYLTSQQHASLSQGRICSDNFLRAATLRYKLQTKLSISPSHSMLTPGQPVPALTLLHQAPGRVATGVPILKSLV